MKVPDLSTFNSRIKPVPFQKPTIIREFTFDKHRVLHVNGQPKQMSVPSSFFRNSSVFNGFERVCPTRTDWRTISQNGFDGPMATTVAEHLQSMFHVLQVPQPFAAKEGSIFCFRGILTLLLSTPLDKEKEWMIHIHRSSTADGHYYLCEGDPKMALLNDPSIPLKQRKLMYSGFKFESLLMSTCPTMQERQREVVELNEEYNIIYQTKIACHPLVVGAEVDGVKDEGRTTTMVELKTSSYRFGHTLRDEFMKGNHFFRLKVIKWWLQSYLAGVELLVIGWRDWNGKIVAIEEVKLPIIPRLLKELHSSDPAWDLNSLFSWGDQLLSWIKQDSFMESGSFTSIRYKDGEVSKITNCGTPIFM